MTPYGEFSSDLLLSSPRNNVLCLLKKSVRFKAIEVCGLKQFAIK